ncbi:aminotransferase class V-fold PLP-dependent enzyme [Nocardiopsis rhodophaea]|uniref:Aminotransferase class V-fold PLP-dependent enzyme n=1 Tax=Nocardiopsis rhodophaea TaxID=280238 RepID=A0ABN2SFK3_9ACTN
MSTVGESPRASTGVSRRALLGGGLAGAALTAAAPTAAAAASGPAAPATEDWSSIRDQFALTRDYAQFTAFILGTPADTVRGRIGEYQRQMDRDPHRYGMGANDMANSEVTRQVVADHIGADPGEIALTDSATMGLGLVYRGLRLRRGQEVLTTEHDFYATHEALRLHAEVTGCRVRKVRLYEDPARATKDEILGRLRRSIRPWTRVLAITSVHSSTGVRLPTADIGRLAAEINAARHRRRRLLVCVDATHDFAATTHSVEGLGCDFFITSGHKWLFGPRGTGFVWGRREAWEALQAVIPSFSEEAIVAWIEGRVPVGPPGVLHTPGGYHTFEARWALPEAIRFHRGIGTDRITARIQQLATRLKEAVAELDHVTLRTPMSADMSAGIVCLSVDGMTPRAAAERLIDEHRVYAGAAPYRESYLRLGPSLATLEDDVDHAVRAIAALR